MAHALRIIEPFHFFCGLVRYVIHRNWYPNFSSYKKMNELLLFLAIRAPSECSLVSSVVLMYEPRVFLERNALRLTLGWARGGSSNLHPHFRSFLCCCCHRMNVLDSHCKGGRIASKFDIFDELSLSPIAMGIVSNIAVQNGPLRKKNRKKGSLGC